MRGKSVTRSVLNRATHRLQTRSSIEKRRLSGTYIHRETFELTIVKKMVKIRVDGRRLAQNIGEQVIVLGTITNKSSNGRNLELRTTDGVQVNVTLPEPIDGNKEGYIEVHGTVQSRSTISCSSFVHFPEKMTSKFDAEQYNELLGILNVLGPGKWKMSDNDSGF